MNDVTGAARVASNLSELVELLVSDDSDASDEARDLLESEPLEISAEASISANGDVSVRRVVVLLGCGGPHVEAIFADTDDAFIEYRHGDAVSRKHLGDDAASALADVWGVYVMFEFDGKAVTL